MMSNSELPWYTASVSPMGVCKRSWISFFNLRYFHCRGRYKRASMKRVLFSSSRKRNILRYRKNRKNRHQKKKEFSSRTEMLSRRLPLSWRLKAWGACPSSSTASPSEPSCAWPPLSPWCWVSSCKARHMLGVSASIACQFIIANGICNWINMGCHKGENNCKNWNRRQIEQGD